MQKLIYGQRRIQKSRTLSNIWDGILMMMMNCFCGMVDRRKVFSLISSREHCQRSSPSRISDTPRAGLESAQNLNSGLVEWSFALVTTTTRHHGATIFPERSIQDAWQSSEYSSGLALSGGIMYESNSSFCALSSRSRDA